MCGVYIRTYVHNCVCCLAHMVYVLGDWAVYMNVHARVHASVCVLVHVCALCVCACLCVCVRACVCRCLCMHMSECMGVPIQPKPV